MGAIQNKYALEETVILAINAGCDLLLFSNNEKNNEKYGMVNPQTIIDIVFQAITEGKITENRIIESQERIEKFFSHIEVEDIGMPVFEHHFFSIF
jgi:beta-N-acetylhexosaminidase